MWRRRPAQIAVWSALLFVVLPFVVKALGGSFTDGVLMGTGAAIVWYTLETLELRRETANLRQESARQRELAVRQVEIGTEQNRIALQQADGAIRPLLVSRVESVPLPGVPAVLYSHFVLRNIGHGPALFVLIESFVVTIAAMGERRVRIFPVDLVEPDKISIPQVEFHLLEGQGQLPGYGQFVNSLTPPPSGDASARHEITITYEDVQGRRFQSVMEMGLGGTKLLKHGPI